VAQAGRAGLQADSAKGLAVMIMEPLRGGKLVNMLPEAAKKAMAESGRGWGPAEWGLRWLYNQPEVTVVLSGMNSLEMVEENVKTASEAQAGEFTTADFGLIEQVKIQIQQKERVGCTGCQYCMPCPQGVDIPTAFRCYNTMFCESKWAGRFQYAISVAFARDPAFASKCIGCGKCEKHCPQGIPIREKLREADKALRPLPFKIGISLARKFMTRGSKQG
jgi:predicted aldo/keto reductase-like oxidoreductase